MLVKGLIDEDFVNYKKPSMFIGLGTCNWKCCKEANIDESICQNSALALQPNIEIGIADIFERYRHNNISKAIVIGGLEPITQYIDILYLIHFFRENGCDDDFVIYTGYNKDELEDMVLYKFMPYKNIIFKFGRFIPNQEKHYDEVLGVYLVSDNQYGEKIC